MRNETLIAARKKSGKTQRQVAKEVGISEVGYTNHERGTRTPNVITALKIADVLNTTVEELWSLNERRS